VRRDPVKTNVRMGTYTNFVNILDLCAVAVPAGLTTLPGTRTVMPFGVTMIAPAFSEEKLLAVAAAFHAAQMEKGLILGAPEANPSAGNGTMRLAVCGAHMSGMALNWQMQEAGATLARVCATAPCYRMKLVPGGEPLRPGLVRVEEGGVSIGLEVWDMPRRAVGAFLERIPAPLGLGSVELEDGSWVKGFVCESALLEKAEDISGFGSFRAYLNK
ncbi:MAG: hypothetical protein Q4F72_03840, partial [Desulfovibrionaceae bacterium]|nr:hypothetical protein [Desulfovibrionaceae bacterium]